MNIANYLNKSFPGWEKAVKEKFPDWEPGQSIIDQLPPSRPEWPKSAVSLDSLSITHDKVENAIKAALSWLDAKEKGEPVSFVMLGPTGTGKTHIARALLWSNPFHVSGVPIAPNGEFCKAPELISMMPDLVLSVRFSSRVGAAGGGVPIRVIVLDDIGEEANLEYVSAERQESERQSRYSKLFDYFYSNEISVIATSNLDFNGFKKWIGPRATSRLLEMAPVGYIREFFGVPDYRLKLGGRA